MSVQLLDKTRKINKLLHNNNSSKVLFNDICEVMVETLDSNILVISRKGKVLGVDVYKRQEWSCTGQGMAKYRTGSGEYALFIITKGSGSITAGGKDYGVNVGNVLAVTPETEVKIQGNAQNFFYYIRLCSCGAQVEECVREAGLAGETPLRSADCLAELTRTVRDMLEAGSADYVERLELSTFG